MGDFNKYEKDFDRGEIFSKQVKAGKRTYFFDVKTTRHNECYITITESRRKVINGDFFYEKHKVFLYREDFEKFIAGFNEATDFIRKNQPSLVPIDRETPPVQTEFSNISFEDLGKNFENIEKPENSL